MAYIVNKSKTKVTLSYEGNFEGYSFKPKSDKITLNVSKVNLIDPKMINEVLTIKFNKVFNLLKEKVCICLEDEDSSSDDVIFLLGEVAMLRGILLKKYEKQLDFELKKLFSDKIKVLEIELKKKLEHIRIVNLEMEDELVR